ncbi:hypothetical protein G6F59_018898 [Rhizopus arrhizus]|nr:hypothetical protein G6F59_018898 [Rhizopus arrhizus]
MRRATSTWRSATSSPASCRISKPAAAAPSSSRGVAIVDRGGVVQAVPARSWKPMMAIWPGTFTPRRQIGRAHV